MNALRYALRQLVRNPAFNAIVVLTLALGIGATSLIFSVIESVLLEPLPYPQSDRIVRVYQVNEGRSSRGPLSDPNFTDLKEQSRSFAAFAQFGALNQPVSGGNEPTRTWFPTCRGSFTTRSVCSRRMAARSRPEEVSPGGAPAVLISHGYWQRYLGGAADFASRSLTIGDRPHAIVGVMPPGFRFSGRSAALGSARARAAQPSAYVAQLAGRGPARARGNDDAGARGPRRRSAPPQGRAWRQHMDDGCRGRLFARQRRGRRA